MALVGANQSTVPSWRTFYNSPITKQSADLQWWALRCAKTTTDVSLGTLGNDVSNMHATPKCHSENVEGLEQGGEVVDQIGTAEFTVQ